MGIKSLTQTIKKNSPNAIENNNLYQLSGKKVAVDASLIIYQQLLSNRKGFFRNKEGKITNHITGLFYKIINYLSLDIELLFVFDGKPPDNKDTCIQERKDKSLKAKESMNTVTDEEEKHKLEKMSTRVTKEMIDDVKHLLNMLGVSYIHPEEGEGEAYASELCRMGIVDYVLTEDMDTMAYGCPKLIRNCVDREVKRRDIVSIFDYQKMIEGLNLTHDKFIEFCILCGCDYCPTVPKIGNTTALKLIHKYPSIEEIIQSTNYQYPENYLQLFKCAKDNFLLYYDKIKMDDIKIYTSEQKISELEEYLIQEIGMNNKRVQTALKKLNNIYKTTT
tara:strand:- start:408 stop:1409 length:1002 start_codon:yes stop_codon:yes gene_type:complete